jgi:hypothetical protein
MTLADQGAAPCIGGPAPGRSLAPRGAPRRPGEVLAYLARPVAPLGAGGPVSRLARGRVRCPCGVRLHVGERGRRPPRRGAAGRPRRGAARAGPGPPERQWAHAIRPRAQATGRHAEGAGCPASPKRDDDELASADRRGTGQDGDGRFLVTQGVGRWRPVHREATGLKGPGCRLIPPSVQAPVPVEAADRSGAEQWRDASEHRTGVAAAVAPQIHHPAARAGAVELREECLDHAAVVASVTEKPVRTWRSSRSPSSSETTSTSSSGEGDRGRGATDRRCRTVAW